MSQMYIAINFFKWIEIISNTFAISVDLINNIEKLHYENINYGVLVQFKVKTHIVKF